jgi:LysR family glycine cleavage system transcriptional activator
LDKHVGWFAPDAGSGNEWEVRRYYDLPSLKALAGFEATARRKSFMLAANELNLTPGAVSRQIKLLEEELGDPLFRRKAGGLEPTLDGKELYAVLSIGFARAAEVVQRVKSHDQTRRVTLACTVGVAMSEFWARHPEIVFHHIISDDAREFRRGTIDLRMRYGFGAWPDETAILLNDETIYPVCGPEFARMHKGAGPRYIPSLPLLHVDLLDDTWDGCDEFLRRRAIAHGPLTGMRFSNLILAWRGLAVGWHMLIKSMIAEGKLVHFSDLEMAAPGGYYITWNKDRDLSPAAETLLHWLIDTAWRDTDQPPPACDFFRDLGPAVAGFRTNLRHRQSMRRTGGEP